VVGGVDLPEFVTPLHRICMRSVRLDPDHDAVMRIGGKAPGGGPILQRRCEGPCADAGAHHLGSGTSTAAAELRPATRRGKAATEPNTAARGVALSGEPGPASGFSFGTPATEVATQERQAIPNSAESSHSPAYQSDHLSAPTRVISGGEAGPLFGDLACCLLPNQSLALRKLQNGGSNRRRRVR
jgi:hypothetical protein